MRRHVWLWGLGALAAVALVAVGRAERTSDLAQRNAEISQIRSRVGDNVGKDLTALRLMPSFACFLYGSSTKPYGLELCVDRTGRVVEAIDRRNPSHVHIGTLRFDPAAATTRIDPARLLALLKERDPHDYPPRLNALPLGGDTGPRPLPERAA